jgi:hypothetical protein
MVLYEHQWLASRQVSYGTLIEAIHFAEQIDMPTAATHDIDRYTEP